MNPMRILIYPKGTVDGLLILLARVIPYCAMMAVRMIVEIRSTILGVSG